MNGYSEQSILNIGLFITQQSKRKVMSDCVISDISQTLQKLLQNKLDGLVSQGQVRIESPAEIVVDNTPCL
jgi:hypothetical protein